MKGQFDRGAKPSEFARKGQFPEISESSRVATYSHKRGSDEEFGLMKTGDSSLRTKDPMENLNKFHTNRRNRAAFSRGRNPADLYFLPPKKTDNSGTVD